MRILSFLLLAVPSLLAGQSTVKPYSEYGELLIARFNSAPFPHSLRSSGYTYDGTVYQYGDHYSDSSVAIFIPKGFRFTDTVDLVFHFHGWFNNIDTTFGRYQLARQFAESNKNAILVVPEGPRNAPDSFGGKLEDKDGFRRLVDDLLRYLSVVKHTGILHVGSIVLSGHSGGYHVISYILMRGGLSRHVKEVYLFDALYGQTEKFVHWVDLFHPRFLSVYTDSGGTREENTGLVADFNGWDIPHSEGELEQARPEDLRQHKIIFLHTNLQHDEVVQARSTFREFLRTSCLMDR